MQYVHTRICNQWNVYTKYIHIHIYIYVYVICTYMFINKYICIYMVQTRLYSFTTTLHFPSGLISLAMQASSSAQAQLVQSSLLPVIRSLLNWQTTQALLATSKLSQPLCYLIHIAATPAISCCSVTGAPKEARPLGLAVLVTCCEEL